MNHKVNIWYAGDLIWDSCESIVPGSDPEVKTSWSRFKVPLPMSDGPDLGWNFPPNMIQLRKIPHKYNQLLEILVN